MADYKPGDLLVGIVDFFAIVLPGAILTFAGLRFEKAIFSGSLLPVLSEGLPRWIAFVLASYLMGNVVFLIGASLIDPVYGSTYRRFKSMQTGDLLYQRVKELKQATLMSNDLMENAFKWARATVKIKNDSASAEIDRLEASSKFFRSLVVVIFLNLIFLMWRSIWPPLLCLIVLLFSYIRYADLNVGELQAKGYVPHSTLFEKLERLVKTIQGQKWLTGAVLASSVIGLVSLASWRKTEWLLAAIMLLMLFLSLWCYASQRWKMTQTAYLYFALLSSQPDDQKKEKSS